MLDLTYIHLAIFIIAITIIALWKKVQIYHLIFHSDGQTQTNIMSSNIQELDGTTLELCNLLNLVDKIQKDIRLLQHNIITQQATENLQTIVDAVHQLVHIEQNTQDNTKTTAQKTTKFQETAQTNSLMTLEFIKRNARRLPII